MRGDDEKTRRILNEDKGLTDETLTAFGVTIKPDGRVVLPYEGRLRERIDLPRPHSSDPEQRFVWGKSDVPITPFNFTDAAKQTVFICEGETDTMRLWQEMPPHKRDRTGVVGLPGVEAWKDEWASRFENARNVYCVFDNPSGYDDPEQLERAWRKMRGALGKRCRRVYLKDDVKDIVELFNKYPYSVFKKLVKETATGGRLHFTALDLTRPPEPTIWLLEDALAKAQVNVLIGAPWAGKSFWYLGLVVAIMRGDNTYCGLRLNCSPDARVIIFDEENPHQVPIWRLNKLGATIEHLSGGRIRYINRQHVKLDSLAEKIIDECMAHEPALAIFDSYDRLHALKDPYQPTAVSALFTECLAPVADITGASVLLLHHEPASSLRPPSDDKPVVFKSFAQRSRGSMAIAENADQGLILERDENHHRNLIIGGTRGSAVEEGTTLCSFDIVDQPQPGGDKTIEIVPTSLPAYKKTHTRSPRPQRERLKTTQEDDDDDTF